jgi:hypothetical protein
MTDTPESEYTIKDSLTEGFVGSILLAPFIVGLDIIISTLIGRIVSQTEIAMSCLMTFAIVMVICGITYLANKNQTSKTDLELPPKQ